MKRLLCRKLRAVLDAGRQASWTDRGGRPAKVVVAIRNGRKFLKTESGGAEPDGLPRLPGCP